MKKTKNILLLNKYFDFLTDKYRFKIQEFEDNGYALNAKFVSDKVGVYFIFEFRDFIPQIQFSIIDSETLTIRPGMYTIIEFYKNIDYQLKSFYLDEILSIQGKDYNAYFKSIMTIEEAIKISSEIVKECATDYLGGKEVIYVEINKWFRRQVEMSTKKD